MVRTLRCLFLLLFVTVAGKAFAQSGTLTGTVLDEKKEPLIGAIVEVLQGGIVKGGQPTDADGTYLIKPLSAGRYDVRISFASYITNLTTGVLISPDKTTGHNVQMVLNKTELSEVSVVAYKVPLIDPYSGGGKVTRTSEEIEKMPTRTTEGVAATAGGVYAGADGLKIGGARTDGTLYIIDGVQVRGRAGINMSQNSIDQIEVMTSGVSAKYGDAIGGIVNITTKGMASKLRGNVLLERSVDGYGHNLANVTLAGPLYSKKVEGGKKPLIGFSVGADVIYDEDARPTYGGNYVLNADKKAELQQTPLRPVTNQDGSVSLRYNSEFVTRDDLEVSKKRPYAYDFTGRFNGRFDFQITDQLSVTAGGTYTYSRQRSYGFGNSVFAPETNPIDINRTGRAYVRLSQRFDKNKVGPDEKKPLISNAYYTLQADYQQSNFERQHPDHKDDIFKYGYLGKFTTDYQNVYGTSVEDSSKKVGVELLSDRTAVGTRFERSELNPLLANYTTQYYNTFPNPADLNTIRSQFGLTNGYTPPTAYRLFSNVGTSFTTLQYQQQDQFSAGIDASFDLQPGKTRHAIEFGLYYQQRVERSYGAQGASTQGGIWQYMRQLSGAHIGQSPDATWVINGQQYTAEQVKNGSVSPSPFDTFFYSRSASLANQSTFDKNLRTKLGLDPNGTDYIDIDNYDPSMFSLNMFSADELLNNGNPFVSYQGYDYTGKKQRGQVNFNDYFTKKDANGNFTRDISAYKPNYIAGYILDKFQFKDLLFNIGVRVDRFDANTKVLKDPYSLYEVFTVDRAKGTGVINDLNGGSHPGNIGSDYVVYVNSNETATPSIVGYRNGDDWYDPFGKRIEDPTTLKNYSGGRDPQPYLVNKTTRISDSSFNPNSSFTDYKPQVNVMPRISFSFPVSDVALFYAHYNVIVQRPRTGAYATANDYYYLAQNTGLINNSDLKPEKLIAYEVGFTQQLSQRSAVTFSGFYKERKDMIQIRPYLYAWPKTYLTYGNRDFSTTKGLKVEYDLRRVGNVRMTVAYTLQFADGTGSDPNSGNGGATQVGAQGMLSTFIAASLPNLRYSTALDYDSRHMIVASVDYRYSENEGPMIGNTRILQNAGANFIFSTRSGEPYTRYEFPIQRTVMGQPMGSRLPWHYMLDLRVDKDFKLNNLGKKKNAEGVVSKPKRDLTLNGYVLITNVLNTRDVLRVNGYTGRPDDDGYITSPQGIQDTKIQTNGQSYVDLYQISGGLNGDLYNPTNINMPRRINLGLQFNF